MKIVKVYDNGGETIDRFTVLFDCMQISRGEAYFEALGLSDDPDWPQGVSMWGLAKDGKHLGKRIEFKQLPENVQEHIKRRIYGGAAN